MATKVMTRNAIVGSNYKSIVFHTACVQSEWFYYFIISREESLEIKKYINQSRVIMPAMQFWFKVLFQIDAFKDIRLL